MIGITAFFLVLFLLLILQVEPESKHLKGWSTLSVCKTFGPEGNKGEDDLIEARGAIGIMGPKAAEFLVTKHQPKLFSISISVFICLIVLRCV